jgi:hypothetical protein
LSEPGDLASKLSFSRQIRQNGIMALRFLICALATLAIGCNVFFSTDSVEFGDGTTPNGTTNGTTVNTSCTGECTCEEDCVKVCSNQCTLNCEAGADCDFTAERGATIRCEDGASCHVDCKKENCLLDCENASCTMRCNPPTMQCEFSNCTGEETLCGPRTIACNATCP